jgi:nitrogen fixation protein NifX
MSKSVSPLGSPVTREAALRIGLAARCLPSVDVSAFVHALGARLGLPVTDEKLSGMTVADLKAMLQGDEIVDPGVDAADLKAAVRYLWGEGLTEVLPVPEQEVPSEDRALTVAIASNSGELLNGHFGSCARFLIYRVSESGIWLIGLRSTLDADGAEDRNVARAELVEDCQLVYVQSIGGPAAAKVVRAGVHPVKHPAGGDAREVLATLQSTLRRPPPWLARKMGVEAQSLARFVPGAEADA